MTNFYLLVWLRWSFRVSACSVLLACAISFFITTYLYISQGLPPLNEEIIKALFELFKFWFPLIWSFTLLLALFRSLKYVFNIELSGYKMQLLACGDEEILEHIGYGDLVKVWRKWFMLMIWLVTLEMILSFVFVYLFSLYGSVFEWFSIYLLFIFILISGYLSFILLGGRCKQVRVVKC